MSDILIGQVLWLVFRFNNSGDISDSEHPYVITDIDDTIVELIQLTSIKDDNRHLVASKHNKLIYCEFPVESVISKDSLAQLNNTFTIDYFPELVRYRKSNNTLTEERLVDLLSSYNDYHAENIIDENKIVHMSKAEVIALNPLL